MPTINIDMDGVVADFFTGASVYLNAMKEEIQQADQNGQWPEASWNRLRDAPHWFRNLPKMPQADEMMALAQRFRDELGWNLRMLTAIPNKNDLPDVFQDKFDWMQEYYPGIRVNFGPYSTDKWRHCKPGDILVDDRADNCAQWQAAGGHAVRVTGNYDLALAELEILFNHLLAKKDTGN